MITTKTHVPASSWRRSTLGGRHPFCRDAAWRLEVRGYSFPLATPKVIVWDDLQPATPIAPGGRKIGSDLYQTLHRRAS